MNALAGRAAVVRYSAANALADFAASYTWSTWLLGWVARMVCQVVFFTLAGRVLGTAGQEEFLLVGNGLMVCVIEAMQVVASTTWERRAGTLPLLIASPAGLFWVFVGRSLQWLASGIATSCIALLTISPFFGVDWTPRQLLLLVPLVAATAAGTYCLGLFLAAFVLRAREMRSIVSNVAYLVMMAICGVQVPTGYWPGWVRAFAELLPLTHGLRAVRALRDGSAWSGQLAPVLLLGLVGAGWLVAARLAYGLWVGRGRKDGSIEFSS